MDVAAFFGAAFGLALAGSDEVWFVGFGFLLGWRQRYKRGFSFDEEVELVLAGNIDVPGKGKDRGEAAYPCTFIVVWTDA